MAHSVNILLKPSPTQAVNLYAGDAKICKVCFLHKLTIRFFKPREGAITNRDQKSRRYFSLSRVRRLRNVESM